jgi:hypothetical protein
LRPNSHYHSRKWRYVGERDDHEKPRPRPDEGCYERPADIAGRGWHAEVCFIKPDETAVPTIERCLADNIYDCVVIGAGVRLPPSQLGVFEAVVNAVHRAAPLAAIAFNTRPEDSGAAAARWI